jgi:hypothetical protein
MGIVTLLNIACYGAAVAGGVALFVAPFTRTTRTSPPWARLAFWISGPVGVVWGTLGMILVFARGSLPRESYGLLVHFKTLCSGIGIGILDEGLSRS